MNLLKWLDCTPLPEFQLYRRLRGGHWEQWHIDHPVCSTLWLKETPCNVTAGTRPGLGRGNPICEDWTRKHSTVEVEG